jgi:3-isopropylmalate/(R)-2-methylmalate dehydratase small subunit
MRIRLEGRARRLGDDVNTDYIIASTRKRETLDESVLKRYLLETVDPSFAASVRPGDLLVAGRNFGCGSAMEIAVTVILAAGIKAVVAESFARTFYRNAINNGLVPVECKTADIMEGEVLAVEMTDGTATVSCLTAAENRVGTAMPEIMLQILGAGGLVPYLRANGGRLAGSLAKPTRQRAN